MLEDLSVTRRPGHFTIVTVTDESGRPLPTVAEEGIEAVITEAEGTTVIAAVGLATSRGWPVSFVGAWLTLDVHSALEAVGLTAAVSAALAAEGIAANMVAGFFHDHLLVPVTDADRAVEVLSRLGGDGSRR